MTLVTFGKMVGYCLKAAEALERDGISCEVINLRSLKPFDRETIAASVRKTHRVASVEEGWPQHGVGSGESVVAGGAWAWGGQGLCPPVCCCRRHARCRGGLSATVCAAAPPHPPCAPHVLRGAEIISVAVEECFDDLDAPPERITGVEVPMPYAENLEAAALPQVDDIVALVTRMVGKQ